MSASQIRSNLKKVYFDDPPPVTFLNDLRPDQVIYRVFSKDRFEEMLSQRKLALVRPSLWDDPYENFLHQGAIKVDGRLVGLDLLRRSFYGQCWTLKEESDAIWRIYAPNKNGVRIKTTVQKLADVLHERTIQMGQRQHSFHKCFIGKVSYRDEVEMHRLMTDNETRLAMIADTAGRSPAMTLLFKRPAFSHEEEVRAIYNTVGESQKNVYGDVLLFDFDPATFIDEICFDPRMLTIYEQEKAKLESSGVAIPITCSTLYKPISDNLLWGKSD